MLTSALLPLTYGLASVFDHYIVQGNEANPEDMQLAVSNPAWAQQASSALAAATRERVELQRAAVEAEDCIVRYHSHVLSLLSWVFFQICQPWLGPTIYYVHCQAPLSCFFGFLTGLPLSAPTMY